ncbi:MAG: hypothetical protein ACI80K_003245 [Paracoccaceae bacterium]|jgi:hypothetical protein
MRRSTTPRRATTRFFICPVIASGFFFTLASPLLAGPAPQGSSALSQESYVKATNTDPGDGFGGAVAVHGDLAVCAAPMEDGGATGVGGNQLDNSAQDAGAVYVYRFVGGQWDFEAYLKASNTDPGDQFGYSLAVRDNVIVVGAPGESSSGASPALNDASESGAVYVFRFSGGQWVQDQYLKASVVGAGDAFGGAVALDRNVLVVGALGEDSADPGDPQNDTLLDAGAAYIFEEDGVQNFFQAAYLKAPDPGGSDNFGRAVGVDGMSEPGLVRALVGAPFEDSNATGIDGDDTDNSAGNAGAAYLFGSTGGPWQFEAYIKASNTGSGDNFGQSVAMGFKRFAIGAPNEDSSVGGVNPFQSNDSLVSAGAAYSYRFNFLGLSQDAYVKASNPGAFDRFGASLAVTGDKLIVAAINEASTSSGINGDQASNGAGGSGAIYLYSDPNGLVWFQTAYIKASNSQANDSFGTRCALSERWLFGAASREDGSATGLGGNQFTNGAANSGAAYLFRLGDGPFLNYCTANFNSTGARASMSGTGSGSIVANDVVLSASSLPVNAFGFFIVGGGRSFVLNPAGSAGNLCVGGGALGRYVGPGQVQNAGAAGAIMLAIDATAIPSALGPLSAAPGDEYHFQAWFRDSMGGTPVSNFTDGLTVLFR